MKATSSETSPPMAADDLGRIIVRGDFGAQIGEMHEYDGWLYCFRAVGTHLVKVGWTSNPRRRWHQLSVASPYDLRLVGMVGAARTVERAFHGLFSDCRVRGEWFDDESLRVRTGIVSLAREFNGCTSPEAKLAQERLAA